MRGEPAVHSTRHRDGQWTALRYSRHVFGHGTALTEWCDLGFKIDQRTVERRPTRPVIAIKLLCLGIPNDEKDITANAVPRGLHQPQSRIGCNRTIEGWPPLLEDVDSDLRSQRMRSSGHAVATINRTATPGDGGRSATSAKRCGSSAIVSRLIHARNGAPCKDQAHTGHHQ